MAIIINIDVMMAKRKMSLGELAERVDITPANLSILKNGKAKAIRFSTLEAICRELECQPGDIIEYRPEDPGIRNSNQQRISMKKLMMLAVAAFAAAGAAAQMNQPIPADPELRTGKLENGMTYYIRHNEKPKGQADFYILHDVGAIQENDSQQGLAHFLEHMAFNGTKNLPGKQLTEYLETVGVKFGANLNAGTAGTRRSTTSRTYRPRAKASSTRRC